MIRKWQPNGLIIVARISMEMEVGTGQFQFPEGGLVSVGWEFLRRLWTLREAVQVVAWNHKSLGKKKASKPQALLS